MGEIIDGKKIAAQLDDEAAVKVASLKNNGIFPHLVVVLVGNDSASEIYVRNKDRHANKVGIKSTVIRLPETTSEQELLNQITQLNNDDTVSAILVQMPLPKQIDEFKVMMAIDTRKDADGFHPMNMGRLLQNEINKTPIACTPKGIITLLKRYNIKISGRNAVIVGRSNIVGKPMAALLLNENATVTITHSYTKNLAEITKKADILIVATGISHLIKANFVKNGAVVIDVGMNRDKQGKLTGDVDFDNVIDKVSYITPVPKGVGPMTIATLMQQTVNLAEWSSKNGR